jgi:DNA replication protein DnaC
MARNSLREPSPDPMMGLVESANDLDLTALATAVPELLLMAEQGDLSYTEFLQRCFSIEVNARTERKLQRTLKSARLGVVEGLEGYNFSWRPQLDARRVKELLNCRFIEERRNVLCIGKAGMGKTRVAKAIAQAACRAGHSTLFVVTAEMLEDLHAAQADGTIQRAMRRYVKPALLCCDEFGHEPFDAEATKYLFRLVSARYGQGSIVLTSNCGFNRWKDLFPSLPSAVSTVERLIDHATILRFTGKPVRKPKEILGAPLDDDEQ